MKKYVKQLEDRLQQTEKKFYQFENHKSQQDQVDLRTKHEELDRERAKSEKLEKLLRQKTTQSEETEFLKNKLDTEIATNELLRQQLYNNESKVQSLL
jgi:hypothetical protein